MKSHYFFLVFVGFLMAFGCSKPSEKSAQAKKPEAGNYFERTLSQQIDSEDYELDSDQGFIKIGNFLDPETKNAVVISFDSVSEFSVYELQNRKWKKVFEQKNAGFARVFGIEPFIEDYNFDGKKDIGIRHEISNGGGIMTFHLYLSDAKTFRYIKDFEQIGNPVLDQKRKVVQGYEACCVFTEMSLTDFVWEDFHLKKIKTLEIGNYAYGTKAKLIDESTKMETKIKLSDKEIDEIVAKYCTNWKLSD